MSESHVVNACIRWLIMSGVMAWRNNSGAYKTEEGRFIKYGFKGSPDIIGITKSGRFLGVEAKFGKNTQSPHQRAFQAQCEENGGLYIVAYSVDDLEAHKQEIIG